MGGICHADGEGFAGQNVLCGLVLCADAEGNLILLADAAPSSIHRIGNAVFIVCGENEYRLGIGPGFYTEILSHGIYTSCQTDIQNRIPLHYNRNGEKINAAHPVNGKIALDIFSNSRYARQKVSDC